VALALPVRVWGMDAFGRPFTNTATTVDISRQGARIKDLGCEMNPGEIIGIQHGNEKSRFRVSWVSVARSIQAPGQIGVHGIEPGRCIWERELKQAMQRSPERSAHAKSAMEAAAVAQPSAMLSSLQPMAADVHPQAQNYACKGTAEIQVMSTGARERGNLSKISSMGCYIETFSPLPAHATVELLLKIVDLELRCSATVRTCDAHVGMGLTFNRMSAEATAQLGMILQRLSPARGMAPRWVGVPASSAPHSSTALGPQSSQGASPQPTPPPANDLAGRCARLVAELADLETFLRAVQTGVDPWLLTEFRSATEHTRKTATIMQQWLEMRGQSRDPFPAIVSMQEHRIHNANLLVCNLLDELEGSAKLPAGKGMDRLIENLRQLGRHVSRILGDTRTE